MEVFSGNSNHKSNLDVVISASDVKITVCSVKITNTTSFILQLFVINLLNIYYSDVVFNQFLEQDR